MPYFIDNYIKHNSYRESSTAFWMWSAYFTISAILRDNVYRREGDTSLFPNIYVILLADSGFDRKGPPIILAEKLIRRVNNVKVISGRASIQAITHELGQTHTDGKTGRVVKGGSAAFVSQELTAGLVSDPQAVDILTDIYEPRETYDTILKTQARINIKNLVFNLFGATNSGLIGKLFDQSAKQGGLLARTFLVMPNEFREPNDLMNVPNLEESFNNLITNLNEIAALKGEFQYDPCAALEYKNWYTAYRINSRGKKDTGGIQSRIHTGIKKIAMILAANELTMHIKKHHIEEAIVVGLGLLPNYARFTMTKGQSNEDQEGAMILDELSRARENKIPRQIMLRSHWNGELFDKVMATFEQAGIVRQEIAGSQINYQLTDAGLTLMGEKK